MLPHPRRFVPNSPLSSLRSSHASLALTAPLALKFPRAIAPFAAVLEQTPEAFAQLHSLLEPGESTWLVAEPNPLPELPPGLIQGDPVSVAQMLWPPHLVPSTPPSNAPQIHALNCTHAAEMVALTDVAFPGFFRSQTCRMGPYFGIRSPSGKLIAMAGERMNLDATHEISGVCTHPAHRGHGYAQHLISHLIRQHQAAGLGSYLHTGADSPALALYRRMGFELCGTFPMVTVTRT